MKTFEVGYNVETLHAFIVRAKDEAEAEAIAEELMHKRMRTRAFARYLPGDPTLSYARPLWEKAPWRT